MPGLSGSDRGSDDDSETAEPVYTALGDQQEEGDPLCEGDDSDISSTLKPVICACVAGIGAFQFGFSLAFTSPANAPMQGYNPALYPSALNLTNPMNNVFKCDTYDDDVTSTGFGTCTSSSQASLFASSVNVGCMVGALLGGVLVDKLGRKRSIMAAALPFIGGWAWTATSKQFEFLLIARLLVGIAVGVVSLAVPVYIAETAPPRLRGGLGALNQLAITIGVFSIDLLGSVLKARDGAAFLTAAGAVDPAGHLECEWRSLAWIGAALSACLLLCMSLLPESPSWLHSQGREDECGRALRWVRGTGRAGDEALVAAEMQRMSASAKLAGDEKASLSDLLHPDLRMPMVVVLGIMTCQQWSGINAVVFYTGDIFEAAGASTMSYMCLDYSSVYTPQRNNRNYG